MAAYQDTIEAAGIVGETDTAKVTQWKKNQSDLKGPIEVGDSGQIKEWYTETTVNTSDRATTTDIFLICWDCSRAT